MTEPIISPWFFYFLGIIDGIKATAITVSLITGLFLLVSVIGVMVIKMAHEFDEDDEKKLVPIWKKVLRGSLIPFVIFTLLAMFVPTKNTLIWMVVAKNVTYQNVEKAIEAGADFKNELKKDMIEIIETIKGEQAEVEAK